MKLFLSIGAIFLLTSILNFFIPRIFVHKDINEASAYLSGIYTKTQKRLQQLSASWITYRFVSQAAQLAAVSQNIKVYPFHLKNSIWEMAAKVIDQDPEIAIVQVTQQNQTAIISTENAQGYIPEWAKDTQNRLWIRMPQTKKMFLAQKTENDPHIYLLFDEPQTEQEISALTFIPFEGFYENTSKSNSSESIYEELRLKEDFLLDKAKLIHTLVVKGTNASGILHTDATFKKAIALLSGEIFSSTPAVDTSKVTSQLFISYRKEGPYVDLMQFARQTDPFIIIGYSLTNVASEVAQTLQKPVLLYKDAILLQAIAPNGKNISEQALSFSPGKVFYEEVAYIPSHISIGQLYFTILIPESEVTAIQRVLAHVRESLLDKLSYNLLILACVLFGLSLLLLARISKRITKPITQLALASEEIGKGKYEDLELPPAEKRHDEVAILSHSFQSMVASLRDREKIRGVLNKVVSKEIASKILNSSVEVGGEERILTMLFSDIRGFTPLSEILSAPQLIALLNSYMTRMCRIVDETHGVVDKFVGDEIMALYGAPLNVPNHAEKAIEAAYLMMQDLKRWNEERGSHEPQIKIGIGVHTGSAFAGNMGAENRLNYTVVGANVNMAARLCSVAQPMQILLSEETYRAIKDPTAFSFQKLAPITLKGIVAPVTVYELLYP